MQNYRFVITLFASFLPCFALAQTNELQGTGRPSLTGQSGLINMPDARIGPDGEFRAGVSNSDPYRATWMSLSILPRIEGSFRYTRIDAVNAFSGPQQDYGAYKDKAIDVKGIILKETRWLPAIAVGQQDVQGTAVFRANYIAASKKIGAFDFTLGYGNQRIDGVFAGIRVHSEETLKNWALLAEYDARNFLNEPFASSTGLAAQNKSWRGALEYTTPFGLALQVGEQFGKPTINAYFQLALNQREYVPKSAEPLPYVAVQARPTAAAWRNDPTIRQELLRTLGEQDFRNIRVNYAQHKLSASLTNLRISNMSRAIGRATRILLAYAPLETQTIEITYTQQQLPIATYTFQDLVKLQRYFNGLLSRQELATSIQIKYAKPGSENIDNELTALLQSSAEVQTPLAVRTMDEGHLIALRSDDNQLNRLRLAPALSGYFNDPSGAFKYEIAVQASYDARLADKTFLSLATWLSLSENISDVTQPSNSTLPHVRSDIAEYKRGDRFRLQRAVFNQFYQPAERLYARASAGIYEEMYSGLGGQILYVPRGANWSTDLAIDALQQRNYQGWFGHLDYSTVTTIASLNWRLTDEVTTTIRAGQFLARDKGVRLEFKRRFLSGIQIGAYYTVTDAKDTTSPGSPSNPYYDKGILFTIPLEPLLRKDTQQSGNFTLQPWTRDVGQMVYSPADLYQMYEKSLIRDLHQGDGLHQFGDVKDDYPNPSHPLKQ